MENVEMDDTISSREHDQIPTVVEINGSGRKRAVTRSLSDDGFDDDDGIDDDGGNQLPDVEEYKAQAEAVRPRSKLSRRRCRSRMLIAALFVIVATISIVVGVILGRDTAPGDGSNPSTSALSDPTPAPTRDWLTRPDEIRNMVVEWGWSDTGKVHQVDTAQFAAIQWLGDNDPARLEIENSEQFRQRYALAVFYYSLDGDQNRWYDGELYMGLTGDHVCKWRQYLLNKQDDEVEIGVRCHGGDVVKEIFLPHAGAEGEIPDEIGLLNDLEGLILNGNNIRGTLTQKITKLAHLKHLNVGDNFFEMPFPEFLGFMSLQTLDLSRNRFFGHFPSDLGHLSGLETFNIGYNNFTDDIRRLSVLKAVRSLDISNNTFFGTFDSILLGSWPLIEILDMSDNKIDSPLPDNLFEMPELKIIDLHGNKFSGNLPQRVLPQSGMSFLALHDNALRGGISVVAQNLTKLSHLDLSSNWFDGPMPSFEKMKNLRYLFLAFNPSFQAGPIPPSITALPNLVDLSLQDTSRTGAIPTGFGTQANLVLLDLAYNQLDGKIPSDMGKATSLQFLFLSRNRLTGSIPESFRDLTELRTLLLDRNGLVAPSNPVCDRKPELLRNFIADCDEIACSPTSCCTECCLDGAENSISMCNDIIKWDGRLDPVQEYEYKRAVYQFNTEDIFYPGQGDGEDDPPEDNDD